MAAMSCLAMQLVSSVDFSPFSVIFDCFLGVIYEHRDSASVTFSTQNGSPLHLSKALIADFGRIPKLTIKHSKVFGEISLTTAMRFA